MQHAHHENKHSALKGALIMIAGIFLLLYAFNIATTLINVLLVIAAVALMVYGISVLGIDHRIKNLINRSKK